MPGQNKTPLLGWHPPAELSAWVRAEAQRRGVTISVVLNDAVTAYVILTPEQRQSISALGDEDAESGDGG